MTGWIRRWFNIIGCWGIHWLVANALRQHLEYLDRMQTVLSPAAAAAAAAIECCGGIGHEQSPASSHCTLSKCSFPCLPNSYARHSPGRSNIVISRRRRSILTIPAPSSALNSKAQPSYSVSYVSSFYYTMRDAILTCTQKPTWVSLIYRTETTTKKWKTEKLKSEKRTRSEVAYQ